MKLSFAAISLVGFILCGQTHHVEYLPEVEITRDTLDFWHVYQADRLVLKSNVMEETPTLVLPITDAADTLRIVFFTDTPSSEVVERLVVSAAKATRQDLLVLERPQHEEGLRLQSPLERPFVVPLSGLAATAWPYLFSYGDSQGRRYDLLELKYTVH